MDADNKLTTILFFDDQRLNLRDRVTRHVGRPDLIAESIYRDPKAHVGWGYPGVFRDEASGKWRMRALSGRHGRGIGQFLKPCARPNKR